MTVNNIQLQVMDSAHEKVEATSHDDSSRASLDKDLAAAIVPNHAQHFDHATERQVLHKIDLYLIPWMWLGYGFVYYDKVNYPILSVRGY